MQNKVPVAPLWNSVLHFTCERMFSIWENELKTNSMSEETPGIYLYSWGYFASIRHAVRVHIEALIENHGDNSIDSIFDKLFNDYIFPQYEQILRDALNKCSLENDASIWLLSELRMVYFLFHDIILARAIKRARVVIEARYRDAADEVRVLFSDIYSDMFAYYMLRLDDGTNLEKRDEAEKYIKLVSDHAEFINSDMYERVSLLVRMLIVLVYCYNIGDDEVVDFLVSRLPLNGEAKKMVQEECSQVMVSIYYSFVEDYARDHCRKSIVNERDSKDALCKDTMMLKSMYLSAGNPDRLQETIDSLHYFWMRSTQRQGAV